MDAVDLSATLISMAWLIVQDLWNERPLAAPIHAVFLVVSLTIFVIRAVAGSFAAMSPGQRGPFLFIHTQATPLSVFAATLWMGTIALACLTIRMADATDVLLLAGACFSILAIVGLTMVLAIAH
jgi:hypothetical protein